MLHHIELNVTNLARTVSFWEWLLTELNYEPFQRWDGGRSWRLGNTYIVFVQVEQAYAHMSYHRKAVGLNHIAFHAQSEKDVDTLTEKLRARHVPILYEDRHPYAGGDAHYAVFFEDPDRIKVEVCVSANNNI